MRLAFLAAFMLPVGLLLAAPRAVELTNGSFAEWAAGARVPAGWQAYGGGGEEQSLTPARPVFGEGPALLLQDGDPDRELGLSQDFPAEPEETYEVRVRVAALPERPAPANVYLQLRFLPSNQFSQISLATNATDRFEELAVYGKSPAGTTRARIYLYTHRGETTSIQLADVRVQAGVEMPKEPLGVPAMKAPQYEALKDLRIETPLVADGVAQGVIVAPARHADAAALLRRAVLDTTGTELAVVEDLPLPLPQHAVILGNRSTNPLLRRLYDLYYTLLDLKYPGIGGYALHSLHNPFGNGRNAILVGGSDAAGVMQAAERLAVLIRERGRTGNLSLGHVLDVRLGAGVTIPEDIKQVGIWEASDGYGSSGYFGWNIISKHMALYYMTGEASHVREFLRLAFPDAQAKEELARIDGEMTENKDDPLAGPYHYNQHMLMLFWDLIEESPVFTDVERLRVTNALARQLEHDDYARRGIFNLRGPASAVSSRHGQWAAIGLYCLGRYFQRDYPAPVWDHTFAAANFAFHSLHRHDWVAGENDNLFWYSTGIAPIFTYLCLSGDRVPLENGVVAKLLRGQEALLNGKTGDQHIRSASLGFLHKAAYLTGDARWHYYRQDRVRLSTDEFRLGQSFWPEPEIEIAPPTDILGQWTIQYLPEPLWQTRRSGIPLEHSFGFGSFRTRIDGDGDFILLDGFNGASRNPYHTFAILDLRIAGNSLLRGYLNQVLTKADGMVEPSVAMDAGLSAADVVGDSVYARGSVPRAAFCAWQRHLLQRVGRYALVVDELDFRVDSENMAVEILWETAGGRWQEKAEAVVFGQPADVADVPADTVFKLTWGDATEVRATGANVSSQWHGPVRQGGKGLFFSLLAQGGRETPACVRLDERSAFLRLPEPSLVRAASEEADLLVLAGDHLSARGLRHFQPEGADEPLVSANVPVALDWNFATARLVLLGDEVGEADVGGQTIMLAAGEEQVLDIPLPESFRALLVQILARAEAAAGRIVEERQRPPAAGDREALPVLPTAIIVEGVTVLVDMVAAGDGLAVATTERSVRLYGTEGGLRWAVETAGDIRVLHWWPEAELLLVGCRDEMVLAYGLDGLLRWRFESVMDPAVFRAAKTYWFKSAPGHEGIHGLFTANFDHGEPRCFVGSACTLEVLDREGKLVRRQPVFWGPGKQFAIMDRSDGSRDLLIARWLNGTDNLAVVNSADFAERRGFYGVPEGHTMVGGWTAQNRTGLLVRDVDGDGSAELVSATNGRWNRVTVFGADGSPRANAQFGPGEGTRYRHYLRDLAAGDLTGDGKVEILVAEWGGLVVALDHACQRLWSYRCPAPPRSLHLLGKRVLVGCEDGTLLLLDADGRPLGRTALSSDVRWLVPLGGTRVAAGTVMGEIAVLP